MSGFESLYAPKTPDFPHYLRPHARFRPRRSVVAAGSDPTFVDYDAGGPDISVTLVRAYFAPPRSVFDELVGRLAVIDLFVGNAALSPDGRAREYSKTREKTKNSGNFR